MAQTKVIVDNIKRYGILYVDDVVNFFTKQGYTFDQTLLVERIRKINLAPQKYGLPDGWMIGSRPMVVDNKTRRIYCMVQKDEYRPVDARSRSAKRHMKRFKTA